MRFTCLVGQQGSPTNQIEAIVPRDPKIARVRSNRVPLACRAGSPGLAFSPARQAVRAVFSTF